MFIDKKVHYVLLTVLIFFFLLAFGDCSGILPETENLNNAVEITSFVFEVSKNPSVSLSADAVGIIEDNVIKIGMPEIVNRTALVPTILATQGASIEPSSGVSQNFTQTLTYTVNLADTAASASYEVYILSSDNNITSFSFLSIDNQDKLVSDIVGTINPDNTISVVLTQPPADFRFTPLILLSNGAEIEPLSGIEQDYIKPVTYLVRSEADTVKEYTVNLSVSGFTSEKDITEFILESSLNPTINDDVVGTIDGSDISLVLPSNTNVNALVPSISMTGVSIFPESGVEQNFSSPVVYEVIADDNTAKVYTVTVSMLSSDNYITSFRFEEAKNSEIGQEYQGDIGGDIITVTVNKDTDITSIIPSISISEGASISPDINQAVDFSTAQTYQVTAEDGSVRTYTINVNVLSTMLVYKGDFTGTASTMFSIGDYNNERLVTGSGYSQFAYQQLYYKIIISDSTNILYDSTVQALPDIIDAEGNLFFGIDNWTFDEWRAVSGPLYLFAVFYESDGTTEVSRIEKVVQKSPYGDIYTWRDLQNIEAKLDGNYSIKNDIVFPEPGTLGLSEEGFVPIGFSTSPNISRPFTGSVMGNGYTIANFFIDGVNASYTDTGLLAFIESGEVTIDDLIIQLRDATNGEKSISGSGKVGAFAGLMSSGKLENVAVENPAGLIVGGVGTGGIVGDLTGVIIGKNVAQVQASNYAGGIAGRAQIGSSIIAINSGSVMSSDIAGGLIGFNEGVVIGRNTGNVTGKTYVGGIVGENKGDITAINSGNLTFENHAGGLTGLFAVGKVVGYSHNVSYTVYPENTYYHGGDVHGFVYGESGDAREGAAHATNLSGSVPYTTNGIGIMGSPIQATYYRIKDASNLEQRNDGKRYEGDGNPATIEGFSTVFTAPDFVFGTGTGNWVWTDGQMPELILPIN